MATLPKRAATLDINIEEGASLPINLTIQNKATKLPIDLTGYTAKMQIRKDKEAADPAILELTDVAGITLGDALGTVQVKVTASQASTVFTALGDSEGVYDLELLPGGVADDTWRFIEGRVFVDGEVTK